MPEMLVRLGVLVLVSLMLFFTVSSGRRFVEMQRQRALAALPLSGFSSTNDSGSTSRSQVRILAFSSADCHQCQTLQAPALSRVLEARGTDVAVVEVDAPGSPELVQNYRVLTVPTTVVIDATGRAHAVNYGFANTQLLLKQVDELLVQVASGLA